MQDVQTCLQASWAPRQHAQLRSSALAAAAACLPACLSACLQGMGRAKVECISGCTCEPNVLDGWWERHASLQVMHTIRVSPGGRSWLWLGGEAGLGAAAGKAGAVTSWCLPARVGLMARLAAPASLQART